MFSLVIGYFSNNDFAYSVNPLKWSLIPWWNLSSGMLIWVWVSYDMYHTSDRLLSTSPLHLSLTRRYRSPLSKTLMIHTCGWGWINVWWLFFSTLDHRSDFKKLLCWNICWSRCCLIDFNHGPNPLPPLPGNVIFQQFALLESIPRLLQFRLDFDLFGH